MNKYITELIGTMFLMMGAIFGGFLGAAVALMVMVYAGGHISGAHYNPAVTLAVWMRGRISMKDAVMYWVFQLIGAAVGALLSYYLFEKTGNAVCDAGGGSYTKAILAELIATFGLAYVVLNVATAKGTAGNSFYGLAIGGTIIAMASIFHGFSENAFNPAVAFGACIQKSMCWDQIWVYLVGPLGGGALAAIIFSLNNPDDK